MARELSEEEFYAEFYRAVASRGETIVKAAKEAGLTVTAGSEWCADADVYFLSRDGDDPPAE